MANRITRFIGDCWVWVKDTLVPPICPRCRVVLQQDYTVCATCWKQAVFIEEPVCQICGRPFEFASHEALTCGACMQKKPPYDLGRSVLAYDAFSRSLILPFKHGDAMHLGVLMARWSFQRQPRLFDGVDLVVPVPLHWRRLVKRKFNQSAVIAKSLAQLTQTQYAPLVLKRTSYTTSQHGKSLKERRQNVQNVFQLTDPALVRNKSVLLVDDVLTTGATIEACCKELQKGSVKSLRVLTFARVLRSNII